MAETNSLPSLDDLFDDDGQDEAAPSAVEPETEEQEPETSSAALPDLLDDGDDDLDIGDELDADDDESEPEAEPERAPEPDTDGLDVDDDPEGTPAPKGPEKGAEGSGKGKKRPQLNLGAVKQAPAKAKESGLAVLDGISRIFPILAKTPKVGKKLEPLQVGTKPARIGAGIILGIVALLVILPLTLGRVSTSPSSATVAHELPDSGHITVSAFTVGEDRHTLTAKVTNDGETIIHDYTPKVTVASRTWYNPTSWVHAKDNATCTAKGAKDYEAGSSGTVELTCDEPIKGFSQSYDVGFSDIDE